MAKNCPSAPILRFLVVVVTLASAVLMGRNHETIKTSIYLYEANYTYWGAFQFFVIAYSAACFYNFGVMLLAMLASKSQLWRLVVLVDWVMTTLMITSCGMATNSYKELKTGVVEAGWSPQCCIVPGFCNKVFTSLVFGFIGILITVPIFAYSIIVLANPFLVETD